MLVIHSSEFAPIQVLGPLGEASMLGHAQRRAARGRCDHGRRAIRRPLRVAVRSSEENEYWVPTFQTCTRLILCNIYRSSSYFVVYIVLQLYHLDLIILYYIMLNHIIMHCMILFYVVFMIQHIIILNYSCIALHYHCIALHSTKMYCISLYYIL